jgi:hypothetical protein
MNVLFSLDVLFSTEKSHSLFERFIHVGKKAIVFYRRLPSRPESYHHRSTRHTEGERGGVQVGVFNVDENKRAFGFDRKSDSKITPTKPAMLYKEPKERQNSSTTSSSSSSSKCWERGGRGSGVISLPGPI